MPDTTKCPRCGHIADQPEANPVAGGDSTASVTALGVYVAERVTSGRPIESVSYTDTAPPGSYVVEISLADGDEDDDWAA